MFFVFSGFVLILLRKSRIARHVTDNINIKKNVKYTKLKQTCWVFQAPHRESVFCLRDT